MNRWHRSGPRPPPGRQGDVAALAAHRLAAAQLAPGPGSRPPPPPPGTRPARAARAPPSVSRAGRPPPRRRLAHRGEPLVLAVTGGQDITCSSVASRWLSGPSRSSKASIASGGIAAGGRRRPARPPAGGRAAPGPRCCSGRPSGPLHSLRQQAFPQIRQAAIEQVPGLGLRPPQESGDLIAGVTQEVHADNRPAGRVNRVDGPLDLRGELRVLQLPVGSGRCRQRVVVLLDRLVRSPPRARRRRSRSIAAERAVL